MVGPPYHAFAVDAADLAIEEATVLRAEGVLHISRTALRDALEATWGHEGIVGTLTCAGNSGDCNPDHPFVVIEVQGGEYVQADP